MRNRNKILLALGGLLASFAISIPLIQKLSVESMQLQIRLRMADDTTLAEIAWQFEVREEIILKDMGLPPIKAEEWDRITVTQMAEMRGQKPRAFKRDLLDVVFAHQVRESSPTYGYGIGWLSTDERRQSRNERSPDD